MASRIIVALLGYVLAAMLVVSCGDDSPQPPTFPVPIPGASVTVNVSPYGLKYPMARVNLLAGTTSFVMAFLTVPGVTSGNCTATATWSSSNPAIAMAMPDGNLHANGAGIAEIYATCSAVTGKATVTVYESGLLSGTVRDEAGAPIEGASVGADDGDFFFFSGGASTTDAAGHYRLANVANGWTYTVTVSKNGYENQWATITFTGPETVKDFTLKAKAGYAPTALLIR